MREKLNLGYDYRKKKWASTKIALAHSEYQAAEVLIDQGLYREAVVHVYFASFYLSNAFLLKDLGNDPSHKKVDEMMQRKYGRSKKIPERYVNLNSFLRNLRNKVNYRTSHSPNPHLLETKFRVLEQYVKFAINNIPIIKILDLVKGIHDENAEIVNDFSFDVFCPKTYKHHIRLTFWEPPFYLSVFGPDKIILHAKKLLKSLRIKRVDDYVVGLNSKLDQYKGTHLLMLDLDSLDPSVESTLASIHRGILIKSGRGFHFIAKDIIEGQKEWEREMKRIKGHRNLKKILDHDYIDISLQRGYSTIRVSESPIKPNIPLFYKEI